MFGSLTGCWLAVCQSSGRMVVVGQEQVFPVIEEQTGEEGQLDEEEFEMLPVGLMYLHLPSLESLRTRWYWRGLLLALPEVGWAMVVTAGLLEVQGVPCYLIHHDWSFLDLLQDSEGRSQGSWVPQRRV